MVLVNSEDLDTTQPVMFTDPWHFFGVYVGGTMNKIKINKVYLSYDSWPYPSVSRTATLMS